ncbi:MAG: beta-ketoacyl synthase N-terminal-like domain-containing protein [Planctomycetota bacterium]
MAEDTSRATPEPIAIVGMSCLFPRAGSLAEYWQLLKHGRDAITSVPATHWSPSDYFDPDPKAPDRTYANRGGFLAPVDFDPMEYGILPASLEATDTTQLLGLLVAHGALRDAGYVDGGKSFDRSRASVILGVTGTLELVIPLGARLGHPIWRRALAEAGVAPAVADDVVARISNSYVPWQENSFPGLLGNVAAGRIANRLDLGGTNCVVDAACASSLGALHLAALELNAHRTDLVISGGADTFNDIFMYMCFSKTPALSATGDARPFSSDGDGTILGEGIGMMVLKRLGDAQRDGDRVYAVIRGIGASSDGKGNAIYAPSAKGQARALNAAYAMADITPDTIELLEAHGTGTVVGDATEVSALAQVYSAARGAGTPIESAWCALGSVKSQIGHTKAAAGVAGVMKAALALYHKTLPPTIKVKAPIAEVAPGRTPFYLNTERRPWIGRAAHARRAGVSAFGFGGSNFHAVLEEADRTKSAPDWDGSVELVCLGAENVAALRAELEPWAKAREWEPGQISARAAASRAGFSTTSAVRLAFVIEMETTNIAALVRGALAQLEGRADASSWTTPDGAHFGRGPRLGELAFLIPGQGAQYPGMLRDLACQFPEFLESLSAADEEYWHGANHEPKRRLSDCIFPQPRFSPSPSANSDDKSHEEILQATEIAQPSLGAVSIAALDVLRSFRIEPSALAGHSFGELVALCAAGVYSPRALHQLANFRGRLMATAGSERAGGDRGGMLAVQAESRELEHQITTHSLALVVANRNAPRQQVLSGASAEIERAAGLLEKAGFRSRRLQVAGAFHSRFVSNAEAPFREVLRRVRCKSPSIAVYANSTGDRYPADGDDVRAILAGQLARPVEFVRLVNNMYRDGARVFVEVGPGARLTSLAHSILEDRPHTAIALDASSGKRSGLADLARVLAQLGALGHDAAWANWNGGAPVPAKTPATRRLTVKLSGANYVTRPASTPVVPLVKQPNFELRSEPIVPTPAPRVAASSVSPSVRIETPVVKTSAPPSVPAAPAPTPALTLIQSQLAALNELQRETARLHEQFLEGQRLAQLSYLKLLESQERFAGVAPSVRVAPIAVVAATVPPTPAVVVAPVDVVAPLATPVMEVSPASTRDVGAEAVLAIVAEKTGYPVESLAIEMELDADLGIDSIKRVEILSALQERFPMAPRVRAEQLGTLRRLSDLVGALGSVVDIPASRPTSIPAAAPSTPAKNSPHEVAVDSHSRLGPELIRIVAEKTGYPPEMLGLEMELEADLGIDSIKRVEILSALQSSFPEFETLKAEHLGTLRRLADIVAHFAQRNAATPVAQPAPHVHVPMQSRRDVTCEEVIARPLNTNAPRAARDVAPNALVWIVGAPNELTRRTIAALSARGVHAAEINVAAPATLTAPGELAGLLVLPAESPRNSEEWRQVVHVLQCAQPALVRNRGFFVGVSVLGGRFGIGEFTANGDALSAGIAGLVKTVHQEWPDVACKCLDVALPPAQNAAAMDALADSIITEALTTGPIEIGIQGAALFSVETRARVATTNPARNPARPLLEPRDLVVITGGARGVTAEAALALATRYRPTIALVGRTNIDEEEPQWLRDAAGQLVTGEAALKAAIATNTHGRMLGQLAPRELEAAYQRIVAVRAIRTNLARLRATGADVSYHAVDVADGPAIAALLQHLTHKHGSIRGLIHGAGTLADALIENLTEDQLTHVYEPKVRGIEALLAGLATVGGDALRFLVLYSSTTARVGRRGQASYALANEVLNKIAQRESRQRPNTRVLAVNWGPFAGGMVTPALASLFAAEGVPLLDPEASAAWLLSELEHSDRTPVELVVLGGGAPAPRAGAPLGDSAADPVLERVLSLTVSLDAVPILAAHRLDHQLVVPAALMIEWLAQAAMHANPGLKFLGFDEFRVLNGITIKDDQRVEVELWCAKPKISSAGSNVVVELRSADASTRGWPRLHARASVCLGSNYGERPASSLVRRSPAALPLDAPRAGAELYGEVLFHGPALQSIESLDECRADGVAAHIRSAPPPREWLKHPLRAQWLGDPLALDSAFQLLIVWSHEQRGAHSLPACVNRYRQFQRQFPTTGVTLRARITTATANLVRADFEILDAAGEILATLEGSESTIDAGLAAAFRASASSPH